MCVLVVLLIAVLLVTLTVVTFHRQALLMPPLKMPPERARVQIPRQPATRRTPLVAASPGPVDISGPLKERALMKQILPSYPEWAEEDGVTGIVSYQIWVNPEGRLRSFIQLVRASGYPTLDDAALEALKEWEFSACPNTTGIQWGLVTFRFTLDNALPHRQFISQAASLNPTEAFSLAWRTH